ncbi:hypothetical protein E2C06_34445 [Dankookia rubra]|uniref:Uncharacterized protein n=1 Tax=Dankookia rubra TaxID=1442381 RepID=A0A4R5Q6M4_9PROT|nr:hypothetical protein [Dankookia rubra]TDH58088.1 hypothetical protein E2C06_34445 [Dankookia rubra]
MGGEECRDHPLRLSSADEGAPSLVFTAAQSDEIAAVRQTYAAPPPDTVVAPRQQGIDAQDQGKASAVLKQDAQAAEVVRLTQALQDTKQVHALEIERLRAQHAAEMQKLVETLWQAQDTARAASALPVRATETPPLEPRPVAELQPAALPAGQARFMGWGKLSFTGRTCAALERIGRRWATAFRAWS